MKSSQEHETNLTVEDLIDSGQFHRAEKLLKTKRPGGPMGLIYQAEIHIYFDGLEEAGQLLKPMKPHEVATDVTARYVLASGEWHYWRFEYEPALEKFLAAEYMYRVLDDEFGQAKALYNQGRLKRRLAEYEAAQKLLNQVLDLIKDHRGEKKDYLQALINYNLGVCAHQLGQLDKAEEFYSSAIVVLNKLEHGRNYAIALNSYGTLLRRTGKYEESVSLLKEAITICEELAAFEPLACAMNSMAQTLIRMQKFDQAEKLLRESLELHQRASDIAGVAMTLETLAQLALESPDLRKAEEYASEAIKQAELSHNDFSKAEALITLGRVALKRNDFYAAAKPLNEALQIGDQLGSRKLQTMATLYLAESGFPTRPIETQEKLTQARRLLEEYQDVWLSQEWERIGQRGKGDRIKVTPDNYLIINGNLLPDWYAVKEAVETFVVKNALRQSGGSLTKAGKLIGISKVHVREKKLQYGL